MDGSISERLNARLGAAGSTLSDAGDRLNAAADKVSDAPAKLADRAQDTWSHTRQRLSDAPGWFERHKAKFAGFAAGIVVPLVILSLFTVSYRGYGLGENPPRPAQVYTSF